MHDISHFIQENSYWAIILGVLLEGDMTLLFAGMLAHEKLLGYGYLTAFLSAMCGALIGDVAAFFFGRRVRETIRNTRFYRKFHPRLEWLDLRFGGASIVMVKYIYGLRFASSVFWGVSRMSFVRFLLLTLASCLVWVFMLTGLGFLFGSAITTWLNRFEALPFALCFAAVVALLMYAVHHWWLSPALQHEAELAGFTSELDADDAPRPSNPGGPNETEGARTAKASV